MLPRQEPHKKRISLSIHGASTVTSQRVTIELRSPGRVHTIPVVFRDSDEWVNRYMLKNALRKLRDYWRETVLPAGWRERRGRRRDLEMRAKLSANRRAAMSAAFAESGDR